MPQVLAIRHTNDYQEACALRDSGFEPVECAFGQYGSVMGPLQLDHHGLESHREGVALRACRDLYGARVEDPRFVVTGTPDADAVLAIVALAGLVPGGLLEPGFYELVDRFDVDPIGQDLLGQAPWGEALAWFNQRAKLFQSAAGFHKAIGHMVDLLSKGIDEADRAHIRKLERARCRRAREGVQVLLRADGEPVEHEWQPDLSVRRGETTFAGEGLVLVVKSTVWGFDQWYRLAPLVVSYASRMAKITVGCPDRDTAERLLGPGGLTNAWRSLGRGWGGREAIGGSPRGERRRLPETHGTARHLLRLIAERS